MFVIACVSLAVGIVTLGFALLIQSVTKDTLERINAIVDTLPGAYDVRRLLEDMENTGQVRGKVVCDEPKNTHIDWAMPPPEVPLTKRIKRIFWGTIRGVASHLL